MKHFSREVVVLSLFSVVACGSPEDSAYVESAAGFESAPPACLDCADGSVGVDGNVNVDIEQQVRQPRPSVHAYPPQLMFYGDFNSEAGLGPQTLTIANSTSSTILISRISLDDDEEAGSFGIGGAEYFETTLPDFEQPLYSGDEVTIEVSFARSSEQRDALLFIDTTHPSYQQLVVPLSGKYFLW